MENFPEITTSIGKYVEDFVNYIASAFSGFFDFIFFIASRSINGIDDFLVWMPWWVFILIIFALGWYFQSLLSGVFFGLFIFFICMFVLCVVMMSTIVLLLLSGLIFGICIFLIVTFGLWGDMMTTIAIILAAVGISLIVGIPMGVWMSFNKIISNIMRPILDAMQTMPSFVYLIPAIFFF